MPIDAIKIRRPNWAEIQWHAWCTRTCFKSWQIVPLERRTIIRKRNTAENQHYRNSQINCSVHGKRTENVSDAVGDISFLLKIKWNGNLTFFYTQNLTMKSIFLMAYSFLGMFVKMFKCMMVPLSGPLCLRRLTVIGELANQRTHHLHHFHFILFS